MANTSNEPLSERDIYYFRQRFQNRVFQAVVAYFADRAETLGVTKKQIAERLGKDPAQITRWLSGPGNLTLDTVSDLLLALDAEMSSDVVPFDDGHVGNKSARVDNSGQVVSFIRGGMTGTSKAKIYG